MLLWQDTITQKYYFINDFIISKLPHTCDVFQSSLAPKTIESIDLASSENERKSKTTARKNLPATKTKVFRAAINEIAAARSDFSAKCQKKLESRGDFACSLEATIQAKPAGKRTRPAHRAPVAPLEINQSGCSDHDYIFDLRTNLVLLVFPHCKPCRELSRSCSRRLGKPFFRKTIFNLQTVKRWVEASSVKKILRYVHVALQALKVYYKSYVCTMARRCRLQTFSLMVSSYSSWLLPNFMSAINRAFCKTKPPKVQWKIL